MAHLKDLLVNGNARILGHTYSNSPKTAFGTCSTAAGTAAKVVTVADPTWNLQVGNIIGIKWSVDNTASNVTFNVNNSGAKQIWYNNAVYTGSSVNIVGVANRVSYYMYDGTYWVLVSDAYDNNDNTYTSAYCSTAAGTAAKGATQTNFKLLANTYVYITIVNANSAASAITLNINSTGAKPIYINGAASSASNYTLPAGTYLIYYNGTNYYFRTDGKLPARVVGGTSEGTVPVVYTGTAAPTASIGQDGDIYIVTG